MFSKWRDALRHALTLRLSLWYAGLFVASAVVLLVGTYGLLARALAAQDHDVLESMLNHYASEFQRAGLTGLERTLAVDASEGRHEGVLVRVAGPQAEVRYLWQPAGWSAADLSALASRPSHPWASFAAGRDGTQLEVGTVTLPDGIVVQVGRSSHVREQLLSQFRERALGIAILVLGVALVGGIAIAFGALAPVRRLDATIGEILATGRFDAKVPTYGTGDPLDRLGARVNVMLGRIHALIGGMRGTIDNVAHDLRTPLTRFRIVADRALTSEDPSTWHEGLVAAADEADRVAATLSTLIDISEAETGTMQLHMERLTLRDVVDEAASLYSDEADERGLALVVSVPPSIGVVADRARLRQALANLIENAVKYTERGRVVVSATADSGSVTIRIDDTGAGIQAADLPYIWDRLYRGDLSRSTRGLGLGLSMVKAIVGAHGGSVSVTSEPGHGSAFGVTLPLTPRLGGGSRDD